MVYEKHIPGSEDPDGFDTQEPLAVPEEPFSEELALEKHLPPQTSERELIRILREALINNDERPLP